MLEPRLRFFVSDTPQAFRKMSRCRDLGMMRHPLEYGQENAAAELSIRKHKTRFQVFLRRIFPVPPGSFLASEGKNLMEVSYA